MGQEEALFRWPVGLRCRRIRDLSDSFLTEFLEVGLSGLGYLPCWAHCLNSSLVPSTEAIGCDST